MMSGRGVVMVQDTPIPGHYRSRNFLEEAALNPVQRTYGFKAPGREARNVWPRRGELLLPGAYSYTDTIQEALKRQASCSFRSCPRSHDLILGIRDKREEGPAPGFYNLQAAAPAKGITSCFKSRLPRLHGVHSRTPGPGSYLLPWQLGGRPNTEVPAQGLCFRDCF
ncbi:hypothetical protein NHX12_022139 [Muraenolepis orangiensis]|uniref:Uncharacterized protein n=1 Tax=Muraenolepis orangiensis TaxID=630683 RepID=A0A9Q0ITS6_9TELE|nr:hypothetical protein NHX12_022139 [Muraenolepis orangiensis]